MSTKAQQNLGRNIREIRKNAGMNKVEFALQMGLSRVSLDLLESGEANVKLNTLSKLADRLGVEEWELLK